MFAAPSEARPTLLGSISAQGGLGLQHTTAPRRPVLGAGPGSHVGRDPGLLTLRLRRLWPWRWIRLRHAALPDGLVADLLDDNARTPPARGRAYLFITYDAKPMPSPDAPALRPRPSRGASISRAYGLDSGLCDGPGDEVRRRGHAGGRVSDGESTTPLPLTLRGAGGPVTPAQSRNPLPVSCTALAVTRHFCRLQEIRRGTPGAQRRFHRPWEGALRTRLFMRCKKDGPAVSRVVTGGMSEQRVCRAAQRVQTRDGFGGGNAMTGALRLVIATVGGRGA